MAVRDNKTYYWYPYHKSIEYGYTDRLYISSYKLDKYDNWTKDKNNFYYYKNRGDATKPKGNDKAEDNQKKDLVMINSVHKVLTTSQPHLTKD